MSETFRLRERLLSGTHDGFGGPPNNWASAKVTVDHAWAGDVGKEFYSIAFKNDAGEIWIAVKWQDTQDTKWMGHMNASTFRRMALWYLGCWIFGEWCGLRRRLFYWDLHRRVSRYRIAP